MLEESVLKSKCLQVTGLVVVMFDLILAPGSIINI